jgi:arylsulfatase A-like enzyme
MTNRRWTRGREPSRPRSFTTWACLLAVGIGMTGCDATAGRARGVVCEGCNVVLISFDTLRADHVGAYGYDRPTTPNIDALAADGVLFSSAISQSAWTRPAHASMLTGLYPSEHGVIAMSRALALDGEFRTLPSLLAERGYATAAFTGGGNMSSHFGFSAGFDVYESPGRRFQDSLGRVEEWLARVGEEPFFLLIHGYDSHRPYKSAAIDRQALGIAASPPAVGLSRACREGRGPGDLAAYVDEYDAAIHHGDRAVGRLIDLFRRTGRLDNTVILLTSDHGEEFLEHGGCFHVRSLYREVVHVPLIVVAPGLAPRVVPEPVPASVAITPTVLELVGVVSARRKGPSLVPYLRGRRVPRFEYVVSETAIRQPGGRVGHVRALSGARDKLIYWAAANRYEYFDLVADPLETRPIPHAPRARSLLRHLDLWLAAHPPRGASVPVQSVPAALEKTLRALGYVD